MKPPSRKGAKHTELSKQKNRNKHIGKKTSEATKKILSEVGKRPNKGHFKVGHKIANPFQFKRGQNKGADNPMWKGGVTSQSQAIRSSIEYKLWRKAVFERDNYACIWCGLGKSGTLNADHIKPFALYPELRLAIDNGRTLCVDCHKTTDSYLNNKMIRND